MAIAIETFWTDLGITEGNNNATNQYDLYNGLTFGDGFVCSSQYDFFTHLGTNKYEFFKSYNSVDENIVDAYTFYQNTDDVNIFNAFTFNAISGSFVPPPEPPRPVTISVYSQELDFATPLNSIIYRCDGEQQAVCYGISQSDITGLVRMFNSDPLLPTACFKDYGRYYDNEDGRVRLEITQEIYDTICLGGTLTLDIIRD